MSSNNKEQKPEDQILDDSEDNEDVFSITTTDDNDTTNLKKKNKGRPPLGPQVIKLHQDLQEAKTEIEQLNQTNERLKLELTLANELLELQQPQQNQGNIEDITTLLNNQKRENELKDQQILTMTESNLKQGKKITQLLTTNLKLKATNDNLIERLATIKLNRPSEATTKDSDTPRVLMIGDSNARRLEPALTKDHRFTLTLHQNATLKKNLKDLTNNNYPLNWEEANTVLLMLGTNDIQNGSHARETQQMTSDIASIIITKGKKVVICEIPPFKESIQYEMEAVIHNKMLHNIPITTPYITLLTYCE
jgi:hypothetical protein